MVPKILGPIYSGPKNVSQIACEVQIKFWTHLDQQETKTESKNKMSSYEDKPFLLELYIQSWSLAYAITYESKWNIVKVQ